MSIQKPAPIVAAVHDLSGIGRCALTVVIPVISAMGIQVCPLPTAVLSTHTSGYTDMAQKDLTTFMPECIAHWKQIGAKFDAVYSGYLASVQQTDIVLEFIRWQKQENNALAIVDPVMGDEGRLYSAIDPTMAEHMQALCCCADVLTPNLTEASMMLGIPYHERMRTPKEIKQMLLGLIDLGPASVVVTSVPMDGGSVANVCMHRGEQEFHAVSYDRVPCQYPGTGDLFTSVLTGALLGGKTLEEAMEQASAYVNEVIHLTYDLGTEVRCGVQLELALPKLIGK